MGTAQRIFFCIVTCLYISLSAAAQLLHSPSNKSDIGKPGELRLSKQDPSNVPSKEPLARSIKSLQLVKYEICYSRSEAEQVYILWALDNWQVPDKKFWPEGAISEHRFPYCKMGKEGSEFSIRLVLPEGAKLDYCFHVLAPSKGVDIWDTNGAKHRDYHSVVVRNGSALITTKLFAVESAGDNSSKNNMFVPAAAGILLLAAGSLILLNRFRAG